MQKNITLDFTANKAIESLTAGQPLALLPAELAKKLLKLYATQLNKTSAREIITNHISNLRDIVNEDNVEDKLSKAIVASIEWIQERDLITNVLANNLDAYAVPTEVPPVLNHISDLRDIVNEDNLMFWSMW